MPSPVLDQFIHDLFFKVAATAVLCAVLGTLLRLLFRMFERGHGAKGKEQRAKWLGREQSSGPEDGSLRTYYIGGPHCPSCNRTMVKRTARRGINAGSEFWGCSEYPRCRGTRDTFEGM